MRVSKARAAENRAAILGAASRLFRERGMDGAGVAEIAKEAGLTHGALYAHFPSKEALAAEAFSYGLAGNLESVRAWEADRARTFQDFLEAMFSTEQRDRLATGCPLTASASEIARHGGAVCASFARGFEEIVEVLERALGSEVPAAQRRRLAVSTLAAQIGAIAVARAAAQVAPSLSKEVLRSVRETVKATLPCEPAKAAKARRSHRSRSDKK